MSQVATHRDSERRHAWRDVFEAHAAIMELLAAELKDEAGISITEYDVLLHLSEMPPPVRMHELADRVVLSRSGVTRLIDRLVRDGWVERSACSTDARGAEAVLTASGLDRLRAASPTHLRGISDHFLETMDATQLTAVNRAMKAVLAALGADAPPEEQRPD